MNVVLYNVNEHKKINGTLFYGFEYFCFLKRWIPDLKYVLLNSSDDIDEFKQIFLEKYNFDQSYLNDVISLKLIDIVKLSFKNILILDVNTYRISKDFISKANSVRIYGNDTHTFLGLKKNHIWYGWYPFQTYNIKTRLKIYKDIHKTFANKGNKTLITNMLSDNDFILSELKLDKADVLTKNPNKHNKNLFEQINRLVYWHNGQLDKNNRSLVEAKIHNIELVVYLNGHINDSIKERLDTINLGNVHEYYLDSDDILVKDFIRDCNVSN